MTFGTFIRRERKRQGIRLIDLSEMSNVCASTICQIENGKSYPTLWTMQVLLKALGAEYTVRGDNR